jgi:hypothetical protein
MFKSISLLVVILATITFAKEDASGKKKEDVGTVIGIDLGVSFSLIEDFSYFIFLFVFRQHIHVLVYLKMVV